MEDARGGGGGRGGNGKEGKGETKSDFHLPRNSGKFPLDVNGTLQRQWSGRSAALSNGKQL